MSIKGGGWVFGQGFLMANSISFFYFLKPSLIDYLFMLTDCLFIDIPSVLFSYLDTMMKMISIVWESLLLNQEGFKLFKLIIFIENASIHDHMCSED